MPETIDIANLRNGQHVQVRFHRERTADTTMHTVFLDKGQEAGYLRAHFRDPGEAFIWNARFVKGRWLYGVNELEYLTIDEILPQVGESHVAPRDEGDYIYDKHLNRLRARRTR